MTTFSPGDRVVTRAPHTPRMEGTVKYVSVGDGKVRVALDNGREKRFQPRHLRPLERPAPSPGELVAEPWYDPVTGVPVAKSKPVRAPAYLAWIRKQPCAWTGSMVGVEASHHNKQGHGSMASKTDDLRALPLSSSVHRRFHETGCVGSMGAEQTRAWVEEQLVEHLKRYMSRELGVGRVA